MADPKLYLRPVGLLYGATAAAALSSNLALPLAGSALAFTAAELIEGTPRKAKKRLFPAKDLAASREPGISELLERVTAKRPPFAGLTLDRPLLMGIVNVTPDSFSDGGLYDTKEEAITHAATLAREGAAIVDIGGELTRPGSDAVEDDEELSRVVPVIEGLNGFGAVISIDTRKAKVAKAAAKAGAKIFNDVSALTYDADSLKVAAETGMDVVLMHAKGEPKTMQDDPSYDDVVLEVYDYLEERVAAAVGAGIGLEKIAIDPGHRLRQDDRAQSRADGQSHPVPRSWRADPGRRLAQALHRRGEPEARTPLAGAGLSCRGHCRRRPGGPDAQGP